MKNRWQLQEAESRFGAVVDEALRNGPQVITRGEAETVVVISAEEYNKLARPRGSLLEFFRNSPLWGVELDIERSQDTGRDIEL